MGMSTGADVSHKADINVTPMIDVLLVLIIIFMVITPLTSRGLNTLLPQPSHSDLKSVALGPEIVITVRADGTVLFNQEPADVAALHDRLQRLFRSGGNNAVFVRGDRDLEFRQVAEVIDIVKGAGMNRIGLMTQ